MVLVNLLSCPIALWALGHIRPGLNIHLSLAAAFAAVFGGRLRWLRFAFVPVTPELPAIWAVRKRMQRCFVLPNFAGYSQVLRLFPPFVSFASQDAHGSGALVVAGMDGICPLAVTCLVAFALQFSA